MRTLTVKNKLDFTYKEIFSFIPVKKLTLQQRKVIQLLKEAQKESIKGIKQLEIKFNILKEKAREELDKNKTEREQGQYSYFIQKTNFNRGAASIIPFEDIERTEHSLIEQNPFTLDNKPNLDHFLNVARFQDELQDKLFWKIKDARTVNCLYEICEEARRYAKNNILRKNGKLFIEKKILGVNYETSDIEMFSHRFPVGKGLNAARWQKIVTVATKKAAWILCEKLENMKSEPWGIFEKKVCEKNRSKSEEIDSLDAPREGFFKAEQKAVEPRDLLDAS